jgi:hypothetical protein
VIVQPNKPEPQAPNGLTENKMKEKRLKIKVNPEQPRALGGYFDLSSFLLIKQHLLGLTPAPHGLGPLTGHSRFIFSLPFSAFANRHQGTRRFQ